MDRPDIRGWYAVPLAEHTANDGPVTAQDRLPIEQDQPLPGCRQQSALCVERQTQDVVSRQALSNRQPGHTPLGLPRVETAAAKLAGKLNAAHEVWEVPLQVTEDEVGAALRRSAAR